MFLGPRGLPEPILKKLDTAFCKVAHASEFQEVMKHFGIPFVFKDGPQLEKDLSGEYPFFARFLKDSGFIK